MDGSRPRKHPEQGSISRAAGEPLGLGVPMKSLEDYRYLPIHKDLVGLAEQTEVDLAGSGLEELPEGLALVKPLRRLCLAHNRIVSWDGVPLQLEQLDLSHNRILAVSPAVARMPQLQSVNLSHNFIASLGALAAAKSLRCVFMRGNKVRATEQVNSIRALAGLRWLAEADFEQNLIEDLDEVRGFEASAALQALNISKNPVAE